MGKKKTMEERIKSERYRHLFSGYLLYLENEKVDDDGNKPEPSTRKTYKDNSIKFVEYLDKLNLDINSIDVEDVLDYLKMKFGNNSTNMRNNYYAVADFISYVNPSLSNKLDISLVKNFAKKNDKDTARSRAANELTVVEIDKLRNKLAESNNPVYLFAFEMAYIHGFSPADLSKCTEEAYDFGSCSFNIDGEIKPVDPIVSNIIMRNPQKILKKIEPQVYKSYYFPGMGKMIGRGIKWLDIAETRKSFFRCPMCNKDFPPESRYWTLIVKEDDINQTYWIVCKKHHKTDGERE